MGVAPNVFIYFKNLILLFGVGCGGGVGVQLKGTINPFGQIDTIYFLLV